MNNVYPLMADDFPNSPAIDPSLLARGAAAQISAALEITNVLQTTLDIGELMSLYMRELLNHVEFDGIRFHNPDQAIELKHGEQGRYVLSYTLTIENTSLGEMDFFRRYPFTESEVHTFENLLAAVLYPLRNALAYRRALRSALIDPLTGTNNRAAMDMVLKRELELSHRKNTPLCVILLDIDHFKEVNDTYGHSAGDICLQGVAQCVEHSIRVSDLLFRCGGEEFLVLLSQTEEDGAVQLAERIRLNVQALTLPPVKGRRLTVSLGAAQLTPDDTVKTLYDRADAALYQAKHSGRNQLRFARSAP